MKYLINFTILLSLAACDCMGSANFSYSHSWKRESCKPSEIKKLETEYKAKVREYEKKYKGSPGELLHHEKSSEGCSSFSISYTHKTKDEGEAELGKKKALEELQKAMGG